MKMKALYLHSTVDSKGGQKLNLRAAKGVGGSFSSERCSHGVTCSAPEQPSACDSLHPCSLACVHSLPTWAKHSDDVEGGLPHGAKQWWHGKVATRLSVYPWCLMLSSGLGLLLE